MSSAAKSVYFFGMYLLLFGASIVVVPNLMLPLFGFEPSPDVWVRVMGMLVLLLGCYYVGAARAENTWFFRTSAFLRPTVLLFFAAFVLLGLAPPMLVLFGVVDVAGAAWTFAALPSPRGRG